MPKARKRPCSICRRWFRPDARVGGRQHACGKPECQTSRRQKTQASWRRRNRGYTIAWRIDQRAAQTQPPPEALRLAAPLNQLPWDLAKDQFGPQGSDFIGVMGALIIRSAKDQFRAYLIDPTRLSGTLPPPSRKTSSNLGHSLGHTEPAGDDATGVSPTRPAMGASASPPTAPPAAPAGIVG
jgi:hypothetical protein